MRSIDSAIDASSSLRCSVFSGDSRAVFTYCWVMVEPPWPASPSSAFELAARATARGSTPRWDQNRESSIATTAVRVMLGICSKGMLVRFSSRSTVIGRPLAS